MATEGKIRHGYEGRQCALDTCFVPLTEATGAYLHKDRWSGKLVMLCEACSIRISLHHDLRLPRVNL